MKRSAVYFFVLLQLTLQACATLVQAPQYPPDPAHGSPLEAYARVLARYVNERGEVDFPALAADSPHGETACGFNQGACPGR